MPLSKKHYNEIAKIIKQNTDSQNKDYLHKNFFVADLIIMLKNDNPNFDGFRFLEAIK